MFKILNFVIEEENLFVREVKYFWDLEILGIKYDELIVYEKFIEDIMYNGERYEVKLFFKESYFIFFDNY